MASSKVQLKGAKTSQIQSAAAPASGTFSQKLAAALGIPPVPAPGPIQIIYNRYKKFLDGRIIDTPRPEKVHLLAENFPYWIKLGHPDLKDPTKMIGAKASVVIPLLEKGAFDETGFTYDQNRASALLNIAGLLAAPNCIHRNLRNHKRRGDGGIKGHFMYVAYGRDDARRVAFTAYDAKLDKVILCSSFGSKASWVEACAEMPAIYVRAGCTCTCK
jgi:hypothetical protein